MTRISPALAGLLGAACLLAVGTVHAQYLNSYERQNEDAALSQAQKVKEAMKRAMAGQKKDEITSTGITDGNAYMNHVNRLRHADPATAPREKKGMMERLGGALDDMASNEDEYLERRRSGKVTDGFHPLEKVSGMVPNFGGEPSSYADAQGGGDGQGPLSKISGAAANVAGAAVNALPNVPSFQRQEEAAPVAAGGSNMVQFNPNQPAQAYQQAPAATAQAQPAAFGPEAQPQAATAAKSGGLSGLIGGGKHRDESAEVAEASEEKSGGFRVPFRRGNGSDSGEEALPTWENEPRGGNKILPKLSSIGRQDGGGSADAAVSKEPLSDDSSIYVVSNRAGGEFFAYNSISSEAELVDYGTVMQVIKPGGDWSGVTMSDGRGGILRTKDLRRASAGEASGFAVSAPAKKKPSSGLSAMDIMPPVRPSSSTEPAKPVPPVKVPLPSLPGTGKKSDQPLGGGILPPL